MRVVLSEGWLIFFISSLVFAELAFLVGREKYRRLREHGIRFQFRLSELIFVPLPLSAGLAILEKMGIQNRLFLSLALANMVIGLGFGWLDAKVRWHRKYRGDRWPRLWFSAVWMTLWAGLWHIMTVVWMLLLVL